MLPYSSSTIIDTVEIAIGLISEDSKEARNKHVRDYRERYSRKFLRSLTLRDTFQILLATSASSKSQVTAYTSSCIITNSGTRCLI